tara:strand:- start:1027 stop:1683 length:657 start_codon:yes stop_codon:yes gene_type:complete
MPIILDNENMAVFTAPKVASTTLKQLAYKVQHGKIFARHMENGKPVHIHHIYPSVPFARINRAKFADMRCYALVRSPLGRVISCYGNRVLAGKALQGFEVQAALRKLGLPLAPSLTEFIENLGAYHAHSKVIRWHLRPLTVFLGHDPQFYTRVFRFDELEALTALMAASQTAPSAPGHFQKSPQTVAPVAPGARAKSCLHSMFKDDYAAFGAWFEDEC